MTDSSNTINLKQTRRAMLSNLILGMGTALGLGGLAARFAAFLYPVIPTVKRAEVLAGNIEEIPPGGAKLFKLGDSRIAIVDDGTELRAFSAICTHLGCIINWQDDAKLFVCPCHKGVFSPQGIVVSGPPPRPLDPIELFVREDNIYVMLDVREENA